MKQGKSRKLTLTVGDLKKKLEKLSDSLDVVVDNDGDGFYFLLGCEEDQYEGERIVNLITSSES